MHKISYCALESQYRLFQTNSDKGFKSDSPRLVSVCANHHVYLIDDHVKRQSVFKQCGALSVEVYKYTSQQELEHIKQSHRAS